MSGSVTTVFTRLLLQPLSIMVGMTKQSTLRLKNIRVIFDYAFLPGILQ
jgi:hypothetical protein